jgi:hypothetical protein
VSFRTVELAIRQLKYRKGIPSDELVSILTNISTYLSDDQTILECLMLLPKYREGLHLLGSGLFSTDFQIVRLAFEILKKIQKLRVGRDIVFNTNAVIQQAYFKQAPIIMADPAAIRYLS